MTGIDLPAGTPRPVQSRSWLRLPASRGGLAWLLVLAIVGLFLAVQFGRQVYANWQITQEADAARAQIAQVEAQNEQLRAELRYLQSDAYVSAEARRLTDLGVEGERVLIIPPGAEEPLPPELAAPTTADKPLLEQWLDLFFGSDSLPHDPQS